MRILIGLDGSEASTSALLNIRQAGLPRVAEAIILVIADKASVHAGNFEKVSKTGRRTFDDAFPQWKIGLEKASGGITQEILKRARTFLPDLIATGEPADFGTKSDLIVDDSFKSLISDADCSVRISRTCWCADEVPFRILVGFNGSAGALSAVDTIASRSWPVGTEVRLLAVADSTVLRSIGRFTPQMNDIGVETKLTAQWAETLAAESLNKLRRSGVSSSVKVLPGDPATVIVDEARTWQAENIFLGPHSADGLFGRSGYGDVCSDVAVSAHCSVEVVRRR